jgi:hypothetical protein
MKKKIIIIIFCTLFISTTSISVAFNVENNENSSRGWSEKQKILASDGGINDRFGNSVDINGNDIIIGSYFDDVSAQMNAGSTYVFVYNGATWLQQAKLVASDASSDDEFGYSVSIDGDYAIVGSHKDDDGGAESGSAYIFYRTGGSWSQQTKLVASDATSGDYFGKSVSIDGEYAIIGAPGKSSNQGFSYIFKRTGTTWSQMTKIGATGSNKLGWSVSISLPYVIMGAYGTNSNTGAAHIYELVGSSWYGKGKLTASDGEDTDLFGISVDIDSDYAICGAPGHDLTSGSEGAAYIFEKPISGWIDMTETQKITAIDATGGDSFGTSVSVYGNYVVVSSPDDSDSGTSSGSAYIFSRGSLIWSQTAKLTASDAATQDFFGWGVSVGGNFVIAGAYAEDNANGADAGSAYIFEFVNQPPSTPGISGTLNGKVGDSYTYTFVSTDPDGDEIRYIIDWGDTNTDTTDFASSGTPQDKSHAWTSEGSYIIKAKARDVHGAESAWGQITVNMPREKIIKQPILKIIQNHPYLIILLRQILGL